MSRTTAPSTIGNRLAPPRFILFLLLLAGVGGGALASGATAAQAVMIGFDVAAMLFLLSCVPLFRSGDAATIRQHAAQNDANRVTLLAITGAVTAVVLVAVAAELGETRTAAKTLVLGTLTLAWLFSNSVYALHYAHLFYSRDETGSDAGGIDFPKTEEPDYWDFVYFAFTLGMTFQTSDVEISDRGIRRVAIAHCLAAFLFNLGVIAFTINVLGSGG